MSVSLQIRQDALDHIGELFQMGLGARPVVHVALKVTGKAAEYFLVWEWGRVSCNPGPKTLWSTNVNGEVVVLTKTAPHGYIRINRREYAKIIRREVAKIKWNSVKPKNIPKVIKSHLEEAADKCADLIAQTAPVDTGRLRRAIRRTSAQEGSEDTFILRTRIRQ